MALDLEEQEQLDDAKAWWKQHGNKVIWGVTLFLVAVAGWRAWETWQRNQAASASMLFDQVVQAANRGDAKAAKDAAAQIMEAHGRSAYATPAAWLAGHINYEAGDLKSARAQYEYAMQHARDDGARQLARLRLAGLLFEQKELDAALKQLEGAFAPAFQGLEGQLRGDILVAQGKTAEAREAYKQALEKLGDTSPLKPLVEIRLDGLGG
ncbi:MAG: tetratricopeptide repeat protein [Betaproteobacteria bacterium]|nr:tetratricopeptide repeat protein [Betaproteobacteria bacterium]